jgi:hypothetical protein
VEWAIGVPMAGDYDVTVRYSAALPVQQTLSAMDIMQISSLFLERVDTLTWKQRPRALICPKVSAPCGFLREI